MTDFEKIKTALLKGGYKLDIHLEVNDFDSKKTIYLSHGAFDNYDTCFEFDGEGNLIEIN